MPVVEYILKGDAAGAEGAFKGAAKAAGVAAAAVIGVSKAYNKLIADTVKVVDQVNTLANATGLSTNAINGLRHAAKASGKELSDIVPTKLAKNMLAAADSGGAMADAFARIGVDFAASNGDLRDANEVFGDLIDGLSEMENRTEAAAIASQLLGKNGRELLTAFDNQEGFQKFVDLGNEFGIKTGPAAVKAAGEWQAATANLSLAFENAGASFLETFGGSGFVTSTMEAFSLGFVALTSFMADVTSGIFDNIQAGSKAVRKALEGDFIGAEYALLELRATGDIVGDAFDRAKDKAFTFWELQTRDAPKAAALVGDNGSGSFGGALGEVNESSRNWPPPSTSSSSGTSPSICSVMRTPSPTILTASSVTLSALVTNSTTSPTAGVVKASNRWWTSPSPPWVLGAMRSKASQKRAPKPTATSSTCSRPPQSRGSSSTLGALSCRHWLPCQHPQVPSSPRPWLPQEPHSWQASQPSPSTARALSPSRAYRALVAEVAPAEVERPRQLAQHRRALTRPSQQPPKACRWLSSSVTRYTTPPSPTPRRYPAPLWQR